jgi:hypothetical protein
MTYQPIKHAIVYERSGVTKKVAWDLSLKEAKRLIASYRCAFGRYSIVRQATLEN